MSEKEPYLPLFCGDFIGDTTHLSQKEIGQYILLLMAMWRNGGVLPDDPRRLKRMARGTISDAVMNYFTPGEGGITQKRLKKEFKYVQERNAKQAANANARWLKNKETNDAVADAKAMPNGCPQPNPTQIEEIEQVVTPITRARRASVCPRFEAWWVIFPNRVGKAAALKAFKRAEVRATLRELIDGLQRYIASKPPERPWCNPATWLNQDRWLDEPAKTGNGHKRSAYADACFEMMEGARHEPTISAIEDFRTKARD
jgi:uncharacterized protein YdaU (DUF1376 family)